jgi:hypothetical protein
MAIDKIIKSNRLLQSRRYTVASLTDAQEAFTSVLDINSKEVYAQANLLPTSSLPFSGSSQNGNIYSVEGQNLLRYWYQQTLTPSNVVSASLVDAWFFLDPSGSSITPQIIQSSQQNNFISNKYASPSLTNADAQDNPPGYNVVVLIDDIKQNPANYQFDYKNGVLQFNVAAPTPLQTVKVTAYQYVGQTVDTTLTNLSASISDISSSLSNLSQNKIVEGSVTASVSSGSNSFTLTSGSNELFTVRNSGQTIISGSLDVTGSINGLLISRGNGNMSSNVSIGATTAFSPSNAGFNNTAIGYNSLQYNQIGLNNTGIGGYSLRNNTTGNNNTSIGYYSLTQNSTGQSNTAIGKRSLYSNTIGSNNTGIGDYSLQNNQIGFNNTAIGLNSLGQNTIGGNNTAIGLNSLQSNTTGNDNIAFGQDSGRFIADGSSANGIPSASIFIGRNTRALGYNQTNQIVIGDSAIGLGSNTVVLGNTDITTTALRGNVGIGKTNPNARLDVSGSAIISGSLIVTNGITGSLFGTSSFAVSASIAATASYVPASAVVGLNLNQIATGSISASVFINSPTAFNIVSSSITLLSVSTASVVTVPNLIVSENLTVNGTASFVNVDNLNIKDKFILINSGSSTLSDSGWITQYNAAGSGSAFYLEAGTTGDTGTYGRFAVAYDVIGTTQTVTANEFVVTAKQASGAPPATPTWGGTTNGFGNIYVNSDNGEIYIYT